MIGGPNIFCPPCQIFFPACRSLSPFPSYHPCTNIFFPDGVVPSAGAGAGAGEEPPSYTAVFTGDTETVTPPPTYSNIQDTV